MTARLASRAATGQILVTTEGAAAADLDPALERQRTRPQGKQVPIEVVTLRV